MPTLQVRDLPEHIYYALKTAAKNARRSLSQQAIIALSKGLNVPVSYQERRRKVLNEIEQNAEKLRDLSNTDITDLIREDRER